MANVRLWIFHACDVMDRGSGLFRAGGIFRFHDTLTKHFLTVTKPFCGSDANVLKRLPCTDRRQQSAETAPGCANRIGKQGTTMFNLDALKRNSRRAAAFGALAFGV